MSMTEEAIAGHYEPDPAGLAPVSSGQRRASGSASASASRDWSVTYIRRAALADFGCALVASLLAAQVRFGGVGGCPLGYLMLTLALPVIWWISMLLAGGYDARVIGLGSDEFRRVINAAASVTAAVVVTSYVARLDLSRSYVGVALPVAAAADLVARYALRKRLHARRGAGSCLQRVIAVGHAGAVADLVRTLRRDSYHGLHVVAACLAGPGQASTGQASTGQASTGQVAGVPVAGSLADVATAALDFEADMVAVLACQEMDTGRLRELAWELEKTATGLCVAPTLLDVAGPRTTIRPVAGLPLLYLDHPSLISGRQILKSAFDRAFAVCALVLLAPVFAVIAVAIKGTDRGPVFFRQVRVGRGGRTFTLYKFRSMNVGAERSKAALAGRNEAGGALFKIRCDPRVTPVGKWLRRWSLDELPQLVNVLAGDMSLVGPRPALPEETEKYCGQMRRRLAVKPGLTGLWQVSGRSDLPWDEAVRLDTRYVENWSFMLDLQIIWKTGSAVIKGVGAY